MESLSSWHPILGEPSTYIIKRKHCDGVFQVAVSDLVHLWTKESSVHDLLKTFQELNPLIECDDSSIVQRVWSFLDEEQGTQLSSLDVHIVDDQSLQVKFKIAMDGLSFKLHLTLPKQSPLVFFNEMIVPFMSTIEELLTRQDLLCSLLEKKDVEIAQYKLEGTILSRRNVETQPFAKGEFVRKCHLKGTSHDSSSQILKVLQAANLLSKDNDLEISEGKNQDVDQPTSSKLLEKTLETAVGDVEKKVHQEITHEDQGDEEIKLKREISITKVPKKKKVKLNL